MSSRNPLNEGELATALAALPGWSLEAHALALRLDCGSFSAALGLIVRIGVEAERLDHHPEIRNVYSRLELRLSTHDAGNQVTALDVKLATRISALLNG